MEWQPIETAPTNGQQFWAALPRYNGVSSDADIKNGLYTSIAWIDHGQFWVKDWHGCNAPHCTRIIYTVKALKPNEMPIHWMPLPEPPK
jgi:hypothetical protein